MDTTTNNDKESATFEEAIEIVGNGYFQIKVAIISGIVILSSYYAIGVITFVLPAAHCDLHMDYEQRGTLASISFVGLIISCHMWGFLSDTLGRRYILIRCLLCDALLYFITVTTPSYYVILFLRFLNGVASCGGVVSIYAYIGEFQTNHFRSRALMIASFIAALGYIVLPLSAWWIIPAKWQFDLYPGLTFKSWRLYYFICGIPSLFSVIFLYFMPESPKFLLAKGENEKAIAVLKAMYTANHKKHDKFTIKRIKRNESERVGRIEETGNKALAVCQLIWSQTIPLLKKPYRFNFTLLCVALFAAFFCNNAMYVWLPDAINRVELYKNVTGKTEGSFCEILDQNIYNSKEMEIVTEMTNTDMKINIASRKFINPEEDVCNDEVDTSVYIVYTILGITIVIVWIIITATNGCINKKFVVLLLATCAVISALSMKWSNLLILMPVKACAIIVFYAGLFPILNSIVVDLFPTNLRAMAGCLTLMASRLGTVVTHELTGFLIKSYCDILTTSYFVVAVAGLLAVIFLPSAPPVLSASSASSPDIEQQKCEEVV